MVAFIKDYDFAGLQTLMKDLGFPAFRAKQLYEWLWIHHVKDYSDMNNLPKAMRTTLSQGYPLFTPRIYHRAVSEDGTRKYVFELHDGQLVEAVGMPSLTDNNHLTVCFSTQVGCAMECAFCATGKEGFTRNLSAGEMVDQALLIQEDFGMRVSNLVAMGQGEPFLNYENVLRALHILNNPKGIAIGARHITVSSCGIIPGITRFAEEPEQFTLAISLHSARQNLRNDIMPRISNMPLVELKSALAAYIEKTNRRVTFEYIMIKGYNDSQRDLDALIDYCSGLLCHINLLPVNPTADSPLKPSSQETINSWIRTLKANGIETTMRNSRGKDIQGACGQLKNSLGV
jgi:23S rRNA (adenine2503-C2)-methyltransferase